MRLVAGLHPDPLGELEPPPDPLAVIGGGKGRKGLEKGIRRKGKEGKDIKGHGGMGRGGRVRRKDGAEEGEIVGKVEGGLELDICPGASDFLVTPLAAGSEARQVNRPHLLCQSRLVSGTHHQKTVLSRDFVAVFTLC